MASVVFILTVTCLGLMFQASVDSCGCDFYNCRSCGSCGGCQQSTYHRPPSYPCPPCPSSPPCPACDSCCNSTGTSGNTTSGNSDSDYCCCFNNNNSSLLYNLTEITPDDISEIGNATAHNFVMAANEKLLEKTAALAVGQDKAEVLAGIIRQILTPGGAFMKCMSATISTTMNGILDEILLANEAGQLLS